MIDRRIVSIGIRVDGNHSTFRARYMENTRGFVSEQSDEGRTDNMRGLVRALAKRNNVAYGEINIPRINELVALLKIKNESSKPTS